MSKKSTAAVLLCLTFLCFGKSGPAADYKDPETDMEFVFVQGGCYFMGNSALHAAAATPRPEVCLEDFYLGKYEVTQAEWKAVMKNNPAHFLACGEHCPVEEVSAVDALQFIERLNAKTGRKYRLPFEAEWEYAARDRGTDEQWAGTNSGAELAGSAWYAATAGKSIHPVGQLQPNKLGIHDMSGNVWEWVKNGYVTARQQDAQSRDQKKLTMNNGIGALRGGSWNDDADDLRVTKPGWVEPSLRTPMVGFRLALPAR